MIIKEKSINAIEKWENVILKEYSNNFNQQSVEELCYYCEHAENWGGKNINFELKLLSQLKFDNYYSALAPKYERLLDDGTIEIETVDTLILHISNVEEYDFSDKKYEDVLIKRIATSLNRKAKNYNSVIVYNLIQKIEYQEDQVKVHLRLNFIDPIEDYDTTYYQIIKKDGDIASIEEIDLKLDNYIKTSDDSGNVYWVNIDSGKVIKDVVTEEYLVNLKKDYLAQIKKLKHIVSLMSFI